MGGVLRILHVSQEEPEEGKCREEKCQKGVFVCVATFVCICHSRQTVVYVIVMKVGYVTLAWYIPSTNVHGWLSGIKCQMCRFSSLTFCSESQFYMKQLITALGNLVNGTVKNYAC